MEKFIVEHWPIAATIINALAGICVFLAVALIRIQFKHIDEHQRYQDHRLNNLEESVSELQGHSRETAVELRHIKKLIEQHFQEVQAYKLSNERHLSEIKELIRESNA